MMAATIARQGIWVPVCRADQLRVDVGVAALVDRAQVALFRLDDEEILAIGNLDPYSRANVLSRGIVGSRGDAVFVASPMHKQPFDLRTGKTGAGKTMVVSGLGLLLGARADAGLVRTGAKRAMVEGVVEVRSTPDTGKPDG